MRQHFEQFGELVDVAVMRDAFGIPRCFGFVQYADPNLHACNPADDHVICNKKVCFSGLGLLISVMADDPFFMMLDVVTLLSPSFSFP